MKIQMFFLTFALSSFALMAEIPSVVALEKNASFYKLEDGDVYLLDRGFSISVPKNFSSEQTAWFIKAVLPEMTVNNTNISDLEGATDFQPVTKEIERRMESDSNFMPSPMNIYSETCTVKPVSGNSSQIKFEISFYNYWGGPHPLEGSTEIIYDADFGKIISGGQSSQAQSDKYEFVARVPQFMGAVRVTSNDVNLRKTASASAARLVSEWPEEEEGGDWRPSTTWSDTRLTPGYTRSPLLGREGAIYPALSHSGEWTRILVDGYCGIQLTPAWIKDNFTQLLSLQPFPAMSGDNEKLFVRQDGDFRGLCMMFYASDVMMESGLHIGAISDNVAVLPLTNQIGEKFNPNARGLTLKNDQYGDLVIEYGPDAAVSIYEDSTTPNLNMLTDSQVQEILKGCSPNYYEHIIYRAGDEYHDFYLENDVNVEGVFKNVTISFP